MAISSALTLLAVITSVASGTNTPISRTYERNMKELSLCLKAKGADMKAYSEETLANIELLTVGYAKKLDAEKTYSIEWSRILTDFDENPFVLVKLNHGFGIYSVMNHVFSEMTVVGTGNPYGEYAHTNNRLKYVWLTDYYVEKSSSEFVCLRDGRTTKDDEELSNLKGLSYEINKKFFEMRGKLREEYIITNSDNLSYTTLYDDGMRGGTCSPKTPYDDEEWLNKEVPNSWYFKNNHRNFPLNESGQCGYTALAMLLGYNEIFGCPGYFSDEESKQWIEPAVTNNYQCEVPNILDEFIFKTWGDDIGGSTAYNIMLASIKFLAGKSVIYKHYTALWEFSNLLFPINNGSPEILFGVGFKNEKDGGFTGMHALTVYGYHLLKDETRELLLTCHFGWESSGPVGSGVTYSQMTIPSPGIFQLGSLYSLFNMSLHHCKAYFQKVNSTQSWCGCGRIVSL
jgi:hypothetical protein